MNSLILPDLLVMDHKRIRALYRDLKAEMDRGAKQRNEEICFNVFRSLKALISAHAKAEEYTAYSLFEFDTKKEHEPLQLFALEGYEEHDLIDKMLKEMGQSEEITPQWRAQLKVLIDLLERHITEEEDNFLPKVIAASVRNDLIDLGGIYLRERDEIFAKKTGLKLPLAVAAKDSPASLRADH